LLAVQVAYIGSILHVGVLVGLLALLEIVVGKRRRAVVIVALYVVAAVAVVAVLYARFLPTLWREVLPPRRSRHRPQRCHRHVGLGAGVGPGSGSSTASSTTAPWPSASSRSDFVDAEKRRVILAALGAGLGLLVLALRGVPPCFRDVKEVDAGRPRWPPVSPQPVWLVPRWPESVRARRWALLGGAAVWGLARAAAAYGDRSWPSAVRAPGRSRGEPLSCQPTGPSRAFL